MDRTEKFNRLVDKNHAAMVKAEDKAAREILQILERSRRNIIARIAEVPDASKVHLQALLSEVENEIRGMQAKVSKTAKESFLGGYGDGIDTASAEIAVFEPTVRIVVPKVPMRVVEILHGKSLDYLQVLTDQVRSQCLAEIEMGVIEGRTYAQIIKRVMAPEGSLFTTPYASAMRTVRQTVSESYNQARHETIKQVSEEVPGLGKCWLSKCIRSTPICLGLHGQKVGPDEEFSWNNGAWKGKQPWAVWQNAQPRYHICHSVIVPYAEHWPENPKLKPLSKDEIDAYQEQTKQAKKTTKNTKQPPARK